MSDLISKSSLISYIDEQIEESKEERSAVEKKEETSAMYFYSGEISVAKRIKRHVNMFAPAVDAAPVVHAEWIHDINNLYGCSACLGRETMSHKKMKRFCPNCGAKMDVLSLQNVGQT